MKGKQYTKEQLAAVESLFKKGKSSVEVAKIFGVTPEAMRKLRFRMRAIGWDVGVGSNAHPMPRPED